MRESEDKVIEKYLKIYEFLNNSDEEDSVAHDTLGSEESKKIRLNPMQRITRDISNKFTTNLKDKYI